MLRFQKTAIANFKGPPFYPRPLLSHPLPPLPPSLAFYHVVDLGRFSLYSCVPDLRRD